jgi:hypothetical protein
MTLIYKPAMMHFARAERHMRNIIAILIGLSAPIASFAADFSRESGTAGTDLIFIQGILFDGDEVVFRKLAATSDKAIVVMDSEGGAVKAALEIGRAIRLRGFATAVAPDKLCASACALTWLAGTPRLIGNSSKLGFHAAYRLVDGKAKESGVGNALVGAYLNQLGLPEPAIIYVTTAPPEGIDWLSPEKAKNVGISYALLSEPDQQKVTTTSSSEARDPMLAVTKFYSALSIGDGETAAAMVIPEKRGRGPFNEMNIHAFYSAMTKPMTLRSIKERSSNVFRVDYHYITSEGRECTGSADVTTVRAYDRILISRIKALDGC